MPRELDETRELRVRVPDRLIHGLLRLKILERKAMSLAVEEAIDAYLARRESRNAAAASQSERGFV